MGLPKFTIKQYDHLIHPTSRSANTTVVHGFNVDDTGDNTVDKIIPFIRANVMGSNVTDFDYGEFGLLDVIRHNGKAANAIVELLDKHPSYRQQFAVGHSNGCAILVEAVKQGADFDGVLLINPALPRDLIFPMGMKNVVVVHTEHDVPTAIARYCNWIPLLGLIVPNAWGDMGKVGATYCAHAVDTYVPAVWNVNMSHWVDGHSHFFRDLVLQRWADKCLDAMYNGTASSLRQDVIQTGQVWGIAV